MARRRRRWSSTWDTVWPGAAHRTSMTVASSTPSTAAGPVAPGRKPRRAMRGAFMGWRVLAFRLLSIVGRRRVSSGASTSCERSRAMSHVRYIDKTREYYQGEGYASPYRWAHFDDVPFTLPPRPLAECRVGL